MLNVMGELGTFLDPGIPDFVESCATVWAIFPFSPSVHLGRNVKVVMAGAYASFSERRGVYWASWSDSFDGFPNRPKQFKLSL
jgi:hypothetical protein